MIVWVRGGGGLGQRAPPRRALPAGPMFVRFQGLRPCHRGMFRYMLLLHMLAFTQNGKTCKHKLVSWTRISRDYQQVARSGVLSTSGVARCVCRGSVKLVGRRAESGARDHGDQSGLVSAGPSSCWFLVCAWTSSALYPYEGRIIRESGVRPSPSGARLGEPACNILSCAKLEGSQPCIAPQAFHYTRSLAL